ncbi:MAG TPA: peptidoglycan DD-metalloendopeptidase family protein [Candidatus Limnocylindria bacterium]|nr:peptidoglycan DD-metalloendopeptidase family protein [Candidatus Limnocylindria bacterium]
MLYGKDTKIKKKIITGLSIALVLVVNFNFALADETSDKLAASQQKLAELNKQITAYQQQIAANQSKASTLKTEIAIYGEQIASTELSIQVEQTQIDNKNIQIGQLQTIIDQKTQEVAENKKILGQLIVELNKYDDQYALKTTIGSSNLSEFFDQIQYTQNLQAQIYELVQKIKTLKKQLEDQQHTLQIQVQQLQELQKQLVITQNSLTSIKNQKQQLLNQTQGQEKNFQKLLASSKQQQVDLQKEVEDLDNQVKAKLGNKTIKASKGVLAWPIDGILTQGYGNTGFTALGYNFHNGIDIAAPAGSPIYSAADGDVTYTDLSDQSFGNWVAVKSTITTPSGPENIFTVYGHMQRFKVAVGQHLSQGDLIGYEGNTGNTTRKLYGPERGYHLHFGVYDADGFGVSAGKYTNLYGAYNVPFGYTYNPLNFLPKQ